MKSNKEQKKQIYPTRVITEVDRKVFGEAEKLMRGKRLFTDTSLSLVSMSAMLGVNRESLSRAINLLAGTSFTNYVIAYRVKESKRLMRENMYAKNAIRISGGSGFKNIATFYRSFKKSTGISPGEYLRSLRYNRLKKHRL